MPGRDSDSDQTGDKRRHIHHGEFSDGSDSSDREEMRDILAGLRSLDSVNGTNRYGQLMEKLSAGSSNFLTGDQSVLIDLSSGIRTLWHPKSS